MGGEAEEVLWPETTDGAMCVLNVSTLTLIIIAKINI